MQQEFYLVLFLSEKCSPSQYDHSTPTLTSQLLLTGPEAHCCCHKEIKEEQKSGYITEEIRIGPIRP